jgi:LmbE family N-acetylglucosaminyl deacetylase
LYFFSTHLRVQIQPSFIFDITGFLETKIAAIQAFDSQFGSATANVQRIEKIRNEALYWGSQIGTQAGEPFVCRENLRISSAAALCSL